MVDAVSGNDQVQQNVSHKEIDLQQNGVDEAAEKAVATDAVSDEQKEAAFGAATAEDQQKERTPIVWVGRIKGTPATTPSAAAETPATANDKAAERPVLRLKPNAGFLLNLVADAERGNKRKCAEEATQVSLNVLGQAVAGGVRPQLARVGPDASDAAVRKVVLSVAQQQKLATCSALLREVAASYGFALHIAPDVGDEDSGEGEDGEGTTASGGEAADGSGTASLANGNCVADRERPGFQALRSLGVRLNLASRREKSKLENAGLADNDDADTAPRLPKPRAPGINMAANRLAGAALGAIGVPNPDKAYAPARLSQSPAPQKLLPAKGEGRTAMFGLDGEEEAMSEVELEELEDLDEGDIEVNGNSADENSSDEHGHNAQHPTSKQGQPPLGKGQFRGGLRMDAHDLSEPEEDSEGSDDGQAAAGTLQWKSATPGLRMDSLKRHESQSGTLASRAGDADVSRQAKQAAAVQPAVDMGRLLSRASAAANIAQQRRDTTEEAEAGSTADQVDDLDMPPAAKSSMTRTGEAPLQSGKRTAQGVLGSAARQAKRAREEDEMSDGRERWEAGDQDGDEKSERSEEPPKGRMNVKRGGRAGRGLFGAAMAGLNGRGTQ